MPESPTPDEIEAAAYPIFVGVARAPWRSRGDDQPCPVKPITKNEVRNLARAAIQAVDVVREAR